MDIRDEDEEKVGLLVYKVIVYNVLLLDTRMELIFIH